MHIYLHEYTHKLKHSGEYISRLQGQTSVPWINKRSFVCRFPLILFLSPQLPRTPAPLYTLWNIWKVSVMPHYSFKKDSSYDRIWIWALSFSRISSPGLTSGNTLHDSHSFAVSVFQSLDWKLCPFLLTAQKQQWDDARGFWLHVGGQSGEAKPSPTSTIQYMWKKIEQYL